MTIWHWVCVAVGAGLGWEGCFWWERYVVTHSFIAKFEEAGKRHLEQLEALVRRL